MSLAAVVILIGIACAGAPSAGPGAPAVSTSPAKAADYEVWVLDQAETSPAGGGTISVYRGADLAGSAAPAAAYTVNLAEAATGVGDGPGKQPHSLAFDPTNSHAVISYVASAHVQVLRVSDRKVVASIRMTAGKDGARQAHASSVSPDGDAIIVANQTGKLLQRIRADFKNDVYRLDAAADLDLALLEDADHPNNMPVTPIWVGDGRHVFVPSRGAGAFLIDAKATPMKVVSSLSKTEIGPTTCCAAVGSTFIWATSAGGATATDTTWNVFQIPVAGLPSLKSTKVLGRTGKVESHGVLVVGQSVWVIDRFANSLDIFDAGRAGAAEPVRTLSLASGPLAGKDPAPDIMDLSPDGKLVFVTLRGKAPVNGNIKDVNNAVGDVGGFAVLAVQDGGRNATLQSFVPLALAAGASVVDPHSLKVRALSR